MPGSRSWGRLWAVLDKGHNQVKLTRDQVRRIKCWTDLNCPLWGDYQYRLRRPGTRAAVAKMVAR